MRFNIFGFEEYEVKDKFTEELYVLIPVFFKLNTSYTNIAVSTAFASSLSFELISTFPFFNLKNMNSSGSSTQQSMIPNEYFSLFLTLLQ